ncbi:MAG: hypothetical protein KA515_01290 [Candidatus Pacebacteria bacterium]|nr:hypothetical protein [Candidatus Paceibacterota bacterium]
MNKEELLQELSYKISNGEMSREDVMNRLNIAPSVVLENKDNILEPAHFSINKMLYVLGASIVVIGVMFFVGQIWNDIGSMGRIMVTLGLGLLIAASGSMLFKSKPESNIGAVFHCIGGILIPGGAMVTLSELSIGTNDAWAVAFTFGVIFLFYMFLNFVHKNAILTFFAIANGTIFIYSLVNAMIGDSTYQYDELYAYLTMVIGLSYLLLAQSFRDTWNKSLIDALCFFGSSFFLGAAYSRVFDSVPWQMFYFLIVIGGIFLSAYMRSQAILVLSTMFLIIHVSYITGKYFADSLGWPISLVILGFIFIGLGYMSININKKYIAQ